MGHDEAFELLAAFALGAVEPAEASAIKVHLAECETCELEVASLEADVAAMDRSVDVPPSLWTKVDDRFRRRFPF